MPELNFVSTSVADPDGDEGLQLQPYLFAARPGLNYGGAQGGAQGGAGLPTGDGFMEYGSGTAGSLPFRVDQDGNVTAASVSAASAGLLPSGDASGAKDAAAINAAVSAITSPGGTVLLAPGDWYLVPGAVTIDPDAVPVLLQGAGRGITVINAVAGTAGDVIRMYNPTANTGGGSGGVFGGGVRGLTIDGTNATAASCGLHIGDMEGAELDVCVQNFSGAGDIGVHIDNTIWWTEKLSGSIFAWNNTAGVVFDQSGTGASVQVSHAYDDLLIRIEAETGQDGVVFQGGADFYNGNLKIRGNFNTGSDSNAALRITGTAVHGADEGAYSRIAWSRLDVQVESNGGTPYPETIVLASQSAQSENAITGCSGILSFFNTWTAASAYGNSADSTGVIDFDGIITGDTNLAPAGGARTTAGPVIFGQAYGDPTGPVQTQAGDFFSFTLTENMTVNLAGYQTDAQAGPQRKTIVIKQAAADSYTVTWPHPGSPSISSPTVLWAGGTAPTMSSGHGDVDVYDLETVDGITWYGRATQNVS